MQHSKRHGYPEVGFWEAWNSENEQKRKTHEMRLSFIFVGLDYPWRVAPQQSPLPFRPNNAKFNIPNYIYNLSKKPATFRSPKNYFARVNLNGSLDAGFNIGQGPNGPVYSIALQPDGKILIAGEFNYFTGIFKNRVARLNSDGSLDNTFNPPSYLSGPIYSLGVQTDGKIIIGGIFGYGNIMRLNPDGSKDTSFNPGSVNERVFSIAIQSDGKILIGGQFTNYFGKNYIARLNANGSQDEQFLVGLNGANAPVNIIKLQDDGKILVGGNFLQLNGTNKSKLGRLNTDGSIDQSFNFGNQGPNGEIFDINIQKDFKILIGGQFSAYNGVSRPGIARILSGLELKDILPPRPNLESLPDLNAPCQIKFEDLAIPTATDNVDGTIQGTTDGSIFPITTQGTTTITWTYTDRAGNSTQQTQNIIIHDTEIPVIGSVEDYTKVLDPGECEADLNIQGGNLILWNKLGSLFEVENSEIGPNGVPIGEIDFGVAKFDNGVIPKQGDAESGVNFPNSIFDPEKGAIEFWFNPYFFPEPYSFGIYAFVLNKNEGDLPLVMNVYWWGEYTSLNFDLFFDYADAVPIEDRASISYDSFTPNLNEPVHFAVVWDRNGIEGSDHTQRIYVNGEVVSFGTRSNWGTNNDGISRIATGIDYSYEESRYAMDNIKVWNYGKTDFSDRFGEASSTGDYFKKPIVTDNCDQVVAVGTRSDGLPLESPYPVGTTTITWTAIDEAGNEAVPVIQSITVRDQGIPVIAEPVPITQTSDTGLCTATVEIIPPVVSDDCGTVEAVGTRSDGLALGEPFPIGVTSITWTAEDISGNVANPVSQTITVVDEQVPVIGEVASISQPADEGVCNAQVSLIPPIVNDNCGEIIPIGTRDDGLALDAPYPVGRTTITWTAADASGNNAEPVLHTIIINDEQKPVIGSAEPISQENDVGQCSAIVTITNPVVLDNCSTIEAVGTRSDGLPLDSDYPVGLTMITWTAQDAAGNTADNVLQEVVVNDTESPNVLAKNLEFVIEVGQSVTITPEEVNNGSTDNCAINSLSLSKTLFTELDEGINEVTLTATDAAGNTHSATAIVTIIVDRSCKVRAIAQDVTLILDKNGSATLKAVDADNGSYSECIGASLTMTLSKSVFTCVDLGPNDVVLTVTDKNGNQGTDVLIVTVVDNLAPTFGSVPKTIKVSIESNSSYVLPNFTSQYTASDNCAVAPYEQSPAAGTIWSTEGIYPVTLTATDHSGNSVDATINVEIRVSKPKGGTKRKTTDAGSRTLGPEETTKNIVLVYPNPATSEANLEVRILNPDNVIIKVIDIHGRDMFSYNGFKESSFIQKIDMEGFAKGLYVIQVQIGFEVITKRLVIE